MARSPHHMGGRHPMKSKVIAVPAIRSPRTAYSGAHYPHRRTCFPLSAADPFDRSHGRVSIGTPPGPLHASAPVGVVTTEGRNYPYLRLIGCAGGLHGRSRGCKKTPSGASLDQRRTYRPSQVSACFSAENRLPPTRSGRTANASRANATIARDRRRATALKIACQLRFPESAPLARPEG